MTFSVPPDAHTPYPWDYWPHEDGRSKCGYVGLTNLGATCYMATCMQHLYMLPQARQSVLQAIVSIGDKPRIISSNEISIFHFFFFFNKLCSVGKSCVSG